MQPGSRGQDQNVKRDGAGSKGFGPMADRILGYCILRIPDYPEEPITGFAGETGRPVCFFINEDKRHLSTKETNIFPFLLFFATSSSNRSRASSSIDLSTVLPSFIYDLLIHRTCIASRPC